MPDRRLHRYATVVQRDDGEVSNLERAYPWNPDKDFVSLDSIARASAAEAFIESGKQHSYIGVSAALIED